jgi:ABC-2 type transport system permease protein
MARIVADDEAVFKATGGGPLGALARAQYAALAGLRWRLWINGLRSNQGAIELGARTISFVFYALVGLVLGAGMGAGAYALASNGMWTFLPILFWVLFVLWQVFPVMLASFQEQFDLAALLRFPVSFATFFLLYVVFGLADTSTVLGGLCCLGLWTGITLVRPELILWTTFGVAGFAAFNILLVRAILAWIDRWLAQRRTREIVGAIFMLLLLSLQLLNPALRQKRHPQAQNHEEQAEGYARMGTELAPWLKTADAVQKWLPPGLAGVAVGQAAERRTVPALGALGALGLWVLGAGGLLAVRLRAAYRGENLGEAPSRKKIAKDAGVSAPVQSGLTQQANLGRLRGSGPIAAMMEKELRTVLRSPPLLYALGVPVLMAFIFGGLFRNGSSGAALLPMALPLCFAYVLLGFTQMIYNNLGAEGAGIQLLFLSPTPIRTVLLAKNLFHAMLFGLVALVAGLLISLRVGSPDSMVVAATVCWALFALPINMAGGNVISLTMPYRINLGRLTRQRGSQANNLLSLLVQLAALAISAAVFWACRAAGRLWLTVPVFLILALGAILVWLRMLRNADAMANARRDSLIATLMKTE